jgi:AbrB family looped-hinge helix DNA binding protein
MKPIKVNAKYQITIPKSVREKLNVKVGDRLLVDVQDGVMILIPEPASYADYLQGLDGEIWTGIDVQQYLNGERGAWSKIKP